MTLAEENYLKTIFFLEEENEQGVSTSSIAAHLDTRAASVSDMLRKLSEKGLISYRKYYGATLTDTGRKHALGVIRRHRLWETFLVNKLGFGWDEVHEVAEQLEHINSERLVDAIDRFLGYPKFDPHGDFIPDAEGNWTQVQTRPLSDCQEGTRVTVMGVRDSSSEFLQILDRRNIRLGSSFVILERESFDGSLKVRQGNTETSFTRKMAEGIFVRIEEANC